MSDSIDTNLNALSAADMPRRVAEWRKRNTGRRVAVFGSGSDFLAMAEADHGLRNELVCIIDESARSGVSIAEAMAREPDAIIIASLAFQELMRRKLRSAGYRGEIVLPYANDPEIGALGLFAHDPSKDWQVEISTPATGSNHACNKRKRIRRILLVAPPFDVANHRHKKTMPMGLLYVAAAVRHAFPDIELRLVDAHIERLARDQMRGWLDGWDYDALFVSYWSAQRRNAFAISDHVRAGSGDVWIVHGGVHPTMCPAEAMQHCDVVLAGEGELKAVEWIRSVNSGNPSAGRDEVEPAELDALPFPAWDLLPDPALYDHPLHVVGGRRFPIIGSRGCPFSCSFCSSPILWNRQVRWRSPANVVSEMDEIASRFGVRKFHFWDDNMVMNESWIEELAELLAGNGRGYQWVGLSRASDIVRRKKVLSKMKNAGCVGMEIGVESFADQVSDAVGKGEFVGSTRSAAQCLERAGIAPLYTHMLFTPGETIRSYPEKERFMASLNTHVGSAARSDSALGQLTTPHVGTRFAGEAEELGAVLWRNASDSYHHRVNFLPNSLLNDIPCKIPGAVPGEPLSFLGAIVQSVYNWDADNMREYVRAANTAWACADGSRSVRDIADQVAKREGFDTERAMIYTCLAVVSWARKGAV